MVFGLGMTVFGLGMMVFGLGMTVFRARYDGVWARYDGVWAQMTVFRLGMMEFDFVSVAGKISLTAPLRHPERSRENQPHRTTSSS
jgi:hypothetical protein